MKNTKRKILNGARKCFNEYSYSKVTIRMIAKEIGISSGNLNYHYRKKEDLLETLYFEMVQEFDQRLQNQDQHDFSLKRMSTEIYSSMQRMVDYRFFWTDLYYLLSTNETIKSHFDQAYQNRYTACRLYFKELQKQNIMEAFSWPEQEEFLIERMIDFSNSFLYNRYIYTQVTDDNFIQRQRDKLLAMLYPHLSSRGVEDFQKLYPKTF